MFRIVIFAVGVSYKVIPTTESVSNAASPTYLSEFDPSLGRKKSNLEIQFGTEKIQFAY
jgi:hypothetical protein